MLLYLVSVLLAILGLRYILNILDVFSTERLQTSGITKECSTKKEEEIYSKNSLNKYN